VTKEFEDLVKGIGKRSARDYMSLKKEGRARFAGTNKLAAEQILVRENPRGKAVKKLRT